MTPCGRPAALQVTVVTSAVHQHLSSDVLARCGWPAVPSGTLAALVTAMRRNLRMLTSTFALVLAAGCGSSANGGEGTSDGPGPGSASCVGPECTRGSGTKSGGGDGSGLDTKSCKVHADCPTACADDGTCASAPSCAKKHGGRTCGPDGNDDCCATVKQGTYTIDKYMVTAGRMRAFVERFDGNIRGFIDGLPAGRWNESWNDDDAIPTDMASADVVLGPSMKKACTQGDNTGHTYWTPKTEDDYSDFDREVLDEKALNCVPWVMLQALCAFDGGHLATLDELKAAFTNGGTTRYPWGDDDLESVSRPDPQGRLNLEGGFATAPLPATYRKNGSGQPAEVSFLIAPPGRFPKGNNQAGIADSAGNLLEFVGDRPRQFVWKADFEHHAANAASFNGGYFWMEQRNHSPLGVGQGPWIWGDGQLYGNAGTTAERNGYYAVGGRCAH